VLQRLTLTIAGETQLARAFDVLAHDAEDLREPLERTHEHLRQVVGEQFQSEGGHGGRRWQDLSPAYARQKADHYGDGRPILVASEGMRAAWLARQPLELTARRLVMGPREGSEEAVRSLAHQTGAGHLPQRRIVDLTLGDKRGIDRIFAEWFSARTRRLIGT
jgi:hypothetical protein